MLATRSVGERANGHGELCVDDIETLAARIYTDLSRLDAGLRLESAV